MKRVFLYLRPYYSKMLLGFSIKFFGTIMDLCIPWVLAHIIDTIIPQNNIPLIFIWGGAMFLFSITALLGNVIANRMAAKVARDTTERIRHDLFEKISYLSSSQIDTLSVSSLISRMTTDTYNIHNMIGMMQRLGVRAPILVIGGILVTLTLDPVLALVLIVLLPLLVLVSLLVYKKGFPLFTDQQTSVDQLVRSVRENITGIRIIKALSKTEYEKESFQKINLEVVNKEKKAGMTMAGLNPIMNLLLNIGLVFVIIIGAYRVNIGTSEIGKIIAFLTYFTIMLQSIMAITRLFIAFSRASASASRIAEVLDVTMDLVVEQIEPIASDYHIEFNHVSFSYTKKENNIANIDFKIKKGGSLGIIGPTGCGKTTLVNLLMRFYDVDEGEILINGTNIKSIHKGKLRRKFGVVFQNDLLFADSIYENIDFGRKLGKENIYNAAEYAQAKTFIENSENTYTNALDAKGTNLSGGQKQRVLISRALAANPEILILDDSSSALDYKTDSLLRKAINAHFKDTTTIIIAQRISSIMALDHILVLEEGKIEGYGTHETLLKHCDIYKEISKSQMGGE